MPFKRASHEFTASTTEVTLGAGDYAIKLGGENVLPFYTFDAPIKNAPKVGIEVSDLGPMNEIPGIAEFYKDCDGVVSALVRACGMPGADFVVLNLDSADPNGADKSIDECVALCKEAAAAVTRPLAITGSGNTEKDGQLFNKIAEALDGKNVLLLSAKEENHKSIAVGAVMAYNQKIGAESSVDINLAKQLNVLISQLGVKNESVIMNLGSAAAGYGFEYVASTMDRVKGAALGQNDTALQMPVVTPVARESWGVKESIVSEEDFPEWGPREQRGVDMEIATASACLAAGSNAVILRHPASVEAISKLIAELM